MSEVQNTVVLTLDGVVCKGCVDAVTQALQAVAGVERVEVSLEQSQAIVQGSASAAELIKAVEQAGYGAQAATS